jgi:hypothetical protein
MMMFFMLSANVDCLVVHSHVEMPEGSMQVLQDSDDDGENAAGGRLLHLLQIVDALNVVCHFPMDTSVLQFLFIISFKKAEEGTDAVSFHQEGYVINFRSYCHGDSYALA